MYPTKSDNPPVATGVPVTSADQYHAPTGPAAFGVQSQATIPWSTGLCHCFDDVGNCCITCWCPCITFGQVAEITDRGSTSCGTAGALYTLILCVTGCACVYSCFYRSKLKEQYYLEDGSCPDCIVHCCCEECSLCQMYRELKNRGFDMNIGWNANMERRGAMAPPGIQGGMSR